MDIWITVETTFDNGEKRSHSYRPVHGLSAENARFFAIAFHSRQLWKRLNPISPSAATRSSASLAA